MSLHRIDQPASDPTTRPTSDTSIPGTASAQPRDRRASHPGPTWGIWPLVERVLPSTVAVLTTHGAEQGGGSGMVLTEDGLILTNSHVVAETDTITVQLSDGRTAPGAVVGINSIITSAPFTAQ